MFVSKNKFLKPMWDRFPFDIPFKVAIKTRDSDRSEIWPSDA